MARVLKVTFEDPPPLAIPPEILSDIRFFRCAQGWQCSIRNPQVKEYAYTVAIGSTLDLAYAKALTQGQFDMSKSKIRTQADLVDPTPASPTRPPVINLIVNTSDGRNYRWNWSAFYAARKMVDYLIADRHNKWLDDNTLELTTTYGSLTITTDLGDTGLSDIMEHEFTRAQNDWNLPDVYIRIGYEAVMPKRETFTDRLVADGVIGDAPKKAERAPKAPKPDKPAKAPKPSGLIDLPTMLKDTDIEPKEARNALRKMGTPKPDHGRWEWPATEADAIKPKIVAMVKKLRK